MKNSKPIFGNVPRQVIPLSSMLKSEKKATAARLQSELEQLRQFQRSLQFPETCSSDKGLEATLMEKFRGSCDNLLRRLMTHKLGYPFLDPVDPVKLNIPDYYSIIKHPMDLGTIKSTLESGGYKSLSSFAADVRLTFTNAVTYNPLGNCVHSMAVTLRKIFETGWKNIENKLAQYSDLLNSDCNHTELEDQNDCFDSTSTTTTKKRKTQPNPLEGQHKRQVISPVYDYKMNRKMDHETARPSEPDSTKNSASPDYDHKKKNRKKEHGTTRPSEPNSTKNSASPDCDHKKKNRKKEHGTTRPSDQDSINCDMNDYDHDNDNAKFRSKNHETIRPSEPVSTNCILNGMALTVERIVTYEERQALLSKLEACFPDVPEHILDFLRDLCEDQNSEDFEVDINSFDDETVIKLDRLLNEHLRQVDSKAKDQRVLEAENNNKDQVEKAEFGTSSSSKPSSSSSSSDSSDSDSDKSDRDSDDKEKEESKPQTERKESHGAADHLDQGDEENVEIGSP